MSINIRAYRFADRFTLMRQQYVVNKITITSERKFSMIN